MAGAESATHADTSGADTSGADTGGRPVHARRVHWHVALTHFPISLLGTAFLFQVLHLFMFEKSFELATTVCILAGAASIVPAIISGWITWKRHYHGAGVRLFQRKIATAFVMLGVSVPLAIWRVVLYGLGNEADGVDHYVFFVLTAGLIAGAVAEGYLGGRLSHKSRRPAPGGSAPRSALRRGRLCAAVGSAPRSAPRRGRLRAAVGSAPRSAILHRL